MYVGIDDEQQVRTALAHFLACELHKFQRAVDAVFDDNRGERIDDNPAPHHLGEVHFGVKVSCVHHIRLNLPVVHQVRAFFAFHLPELHRREIDAGERRPVHHDNGSFGKSPVQKEVEAHNAGRSLLWPAGDRNVCNLTFCIHAGMLRLNSIGREFKKFPGIAAFCRRIFP